MDAPKNKFWTAKEACSKLDSVLALSERLAVLGIFVGILYFVVRFARDTLTKNQIEVFKTTGDTWKAGLFLLLPLFYLTIRTFIEQATDFWGLKRQLPSSPVLTGEKPTQIGKEKKTTGLELEEVG